MERLWLISNIESGSTSDAKYAAIKEVCQENGLNLVGHSRFPDDALPDGEGLQRAGVDTALLFAGDGTINACLCALADWPGDIVILPGGTMNLLAKALHGDKEPVAIINDAHVSPRRTSRPYVKAEEARAYVAVILGPAAHWTKVREAARGRPDIRLFRFALRAWRRTFGETVRIDGVEDMRRGYQAIFVVPDEQGPDKGAMKVAAVSARDWRSIVDLGWGWLRGDWVAARAVEQKRARRFRIRGKRPVLALFDGEAVMLEPGTEFTVGRSQDVFLTTDAQGL